MTKTMRSYVAKWLSLIAVLLGCNGAFATTTPTKFTLWITETSAGGSATFANQLPGGVRSYTFDGAGYTAANYVVGPKIAAANLKDPSAVAFDTNGNLYVSNRSFNSGATSVARVTFAAEVPSAPSTYLSIPAAQTGPHQLAATAGGGIIVSSVNSGSYFYPAANATSSMTFASGSATRGISYWGNLMYASSGSAVGVWNVSTGAQVGKTFAIGASSLHYSSLFGGALYVADYGSGSGTGGGIWRIALDSAGNPTAAAKVVSVDGAISLAFSPSGDEMFVAQHVSGQILGFAVNAGVVATTPNLTIDGGTLSNWAGAHVQFGGMAISGTPSTTTVSVLSGWNLLGNGSSAKVNPAASFGDGSKVSSVWKWVASKANWAFYAPTQADGGVAYAASNGYDFLTSIEGGEGFWVNAKAAFTATVPTGAGIESLTLKGLTTGWSLIATGDNKTPSAFNAALSPTPPSAGTVPVNFTSLWAWDAALAKWYFYAPGLEASGGLAAFNHKAGYLDFGSRTLNSSTGFWVNQPVVSASSTIGSEGGALDAGHLKVSIPPAAVSQPMTVSVSQTLGDTKFPSLSDAFKITLQNASGTSFGLADFAKEVQLEFHLNATVPSGSSSKLFLMISSAQGFSLIPADSLGSTARATLPAVQLANGLSKQSTSGHNAGIQSQANATTTISPTYEVKIVSANSNETDHFVFYYQDSDNSTLISGVKANLEDAYKRLADFGFSWTAYGNCRFDKNTFTPYKIPVYFTDLGGVDPITYGQYGGSGFYSPCTYYWSKYIQMNTNSNALGDPLKAKGFTAHELFHFLQAIYVHSATDFRWIDEASSVWLQTTVANPTSAGQCFSDTWKGYNFTAKGLFNPFNSALGYTEDIDQQHGYATAAFLLYADAKSYFNIHKMWMDLYYSKGEVQAFKSSMSKDLGSVWSEYSEDFYSGKDLSYIKGGLCANAPGLVLVDIDGLIAKEKFTSLPFGFKRSIDLYEFSSKPYFLQYSNTLSVTTDVTFQIKNLIANQSAKIYTYSVTGGPTKLGEITKDSTTLTTKGLELKGKLISIILIDTNIPTSASPSQTTSIVSSTGGRNSTVEVNVFSVPTISSIDPTSALPNKTVTIVGTGFGASQGTSQVTFNGVVATATSWSNTLITVNIPAGATKGDVVVTVGGMASNGIPFIPLVATVPLSCSGLDITIGAGNGLKPISTANPTVAGISSTCDFVYESACPSGAMNDILASIDFSKGYVMGVCANDSCVYQGPHNSMSLGWNGSVWETSEQYQCTGSGTYPTAPAQCLAPKTYTKQWDCKNSSYSIAAQRETDVWLRVTIKKPSCTFTVTPSQQTATTGTIAVTASANTCAWTATSSAAWITVTAGSSGVGNGTASFTLERNLTGVPRNGTIVIAGTSVGISQP